MDQTKLYSEKLGMMIRCPTVSSYDESDLTRFLKFHQVLAKLFVNVFEKCEKGVFNGTLLLRYRGEKSDKPVLFMHHHDVVDAPGDWKYPPFSGTVAEGKLWGRGTLDTKGGLFGILQAAEELIGEGYVPKQDIYILSTCNEECSGNGAREVAELFLDNRIHFSYILDEGGMIVHDPIGGADGDFAMVAVGEKGCADLKFKVHSRGGHASRPGKNTPLEVLSRFCLRVERHNPFRASLSDTQKEMFRIMATKMKGPAAVLLSHPDFFAPLLKTVLPRISDNANAILRTTLAFTMAKGSDAANVLPEEAYFVGNLRSSHHQNFEESLALLRKIASKYGIEVEVTDPGITSTVSDYKTPVFSLLKEGVKQIYPEVTTVPFVATGASDSRFLRSLADVCYGFAPFKVSDEQLDSIHGINENVNVDDLTKCVHFYKFLMTGGEENGK